VLGEGKVLEYDEPKNLMAKEGGVFKEMVEMSGERAELEKIIAGGHGSGTEMQNGGGSST